MRFLKATIVFLAFAVSTPAFAACSNGCPDYPQCTCGGGGGGGGGTGHPVVQPVIPMVGALCGTKTATQAEVNAAAKQCLDRLTGNAILINCGGFFGENKHNQDEDQRTGLKCGQRQTILAQQCRKRCTDWANYSATHWCYYHDNDQSDWQKFFKDIGGNAVGAANVELCGPRLKGNKPQARRTP